HDDARRRNDGVGSNATNDDRASGPGHRHNRRAEGGRHSPTITGDGQPCVPSTGLPHPSIGGDEDPVAIAVRSPSPWVRRCKHVAVAWIKGPGAIHERIPADS